MSITLKNTLQGVINLLWTKPYECFFGVISLLVAAPFMTLIGAQLLADTTIPLFWNLVAIYLCLLVAVTFMLNFGDQKTTAKDVFWVWILLSVGATLLAGFGYLEILFFKWLSG